MKFKAILALYITALFILTGFAVLMPVQSASASSAQTFSFPYSYGTPHVPSDVGAQGTQGLTVPLSQIGPSGHLGISFPVFHISEITTSATLTVTVYNVSGTTPSAAVNIEVWAYNVSTSHNPSVRLNE